MKDFFNKIKTYITGHKAVSIISGVVAAAVVVTVVSVSVVNHKNGVDTGFNVSTPSDENKTITAEEIAAAEANNTSSEETSAAEAASEVNTIETTSNADNNVTNNKPEQKPANSGNNNNNTVSKPSNSGNTTNTNNSVSMICNSCGTTFSSVYGNTCPRCGSGSVGRNTWTCPDSSAHPENKLGCTTKKKHDSFVKIHQENLDNASKPSNGRADDECWNCGRKFGDGHNGTCNLHFVNGKGFVCEYDY